jgi:hypothetical protein
MRPFIYTKNLPILFLSNRTSEQLTILTLGWLVAYITRPTVGWLLRQPTPTELLKWLVVDHPDTGVDELYTVIRNPP